MRRRDILLRSAGAVLVVPGAVRAASSLAADAAELNPKLPLGTREEAVLDALPGKAPLIKLTYRPPNYETPLDAFRDAITSNDRFFVRYHLAGVPELSELEGWKLTIGGDAVLRPLEISLAELKSGFEPVEITAVCQCSGNRRGLFEPHVAGVQWGYGAMGNASWRGARLKDVLAKAGVADAAVEVALGAADGPVLDATPDFTKSIPLAKALDGNTIIAYAMNGEPLPHLNGFPARLVVPGWTATYWVKHLNALEVRSKPFAGYWMAKAYRVPKGLFATDLPFTSQDDEKTTPITQILVNSLITHPASGAKVPAAGFDVEGIAWDGGHGIRMVEVSADGGRSWQQASLGQDFGDFSFRQWQMRVGGSSAGPVKIMARATSRSGEIQVDRLVPNPAGYHHNLVQSVDLLAS
jgi:DMSO/TMAO reductase YedYZ molybdopterin-dependent catalytic subunit